MYKMLPTTPTLPLGGLMVDSCVNRSGRSSFVVTAAPSSARCRCGRYAPRVLSAITVLGWLRFTAVDCATARSLPGAATGLQGLLVDVGGLRLRVVDSRAGFVPASVIPAPDPGEPIRRT
jgi:hypothetical protein